LINIIFCDAVSRALLLEWQFKWEHEHEWRICKDIEAGIHGTFQDTLPAFAGNAEKMFHNADTKVAFPRYAQNNPKTTNRRRM
jgi:hypothetical protein